MNKVYLSVLKCNCIYTIYYTYKERVYFNINRYAGIGRQFPLRMEWRDPCKFKSCYLYAIYIENNLYIDIVCILS